ncbi:MAG: adenosylmethionine--8-amino-7-oxononanoate transaminase [Gammaproteobacteria bacterium CG22_combo_CG10-13_8_21_14_all_40_8]|nr:MAG: adenosylmethionine--8-amino-7-oxononanoate transaminase [Gammaproteobacteria bacterium CG22_combo_CG10-13_8_21_14_all_40_8]
MDDSNIQQFFDQQHVWHPYSAIPPTIAPLLVESAKDCVLLLDDGTELIDGMASWWSVIHGYNHPKLNLALKNQVDKMSHVMFGGLTHQPAIELCQLLIGITASSLDKVFIADSGSVAVEVAMKMAIQYWHSLDKPQPDKTQFLTIKQGYHGDTIHAMSICDPDNGMHQIFGNMVAQQYFCEAPSLCTKENWFKQSIQPEIEAFHQQIQQHHQHLAAVILEPVCQGAGGMRFYSPEFLIEVEVLCKQYQVLLIFDEIATGFGRTGQLFAYEHTQHNGKMVVPDILCVGKALTAGYMSLAAVLTSNAISQTISQGPVKAFMHGPTFMGNPLACAVAVESIKLLLASDWKTNIARIESQLLNYLSPLKQNPLVKDVRVLGAIGVVELHQPVDMQRATNYFKVQGVWLRPFGKLIYMMPPYCISDTEIQQICTAIKGYLQQI